MNQEQLDEIGLSIQRCINLLKPPKRTARRWNQKERIPDCWLKLCRVLNGDLGLISETWRDWTIGKNGLYWKKYSIGFEPWELAGLRVIRSERDYYRGLLIEIHHPDLHVENQQTGIQVSNQGRNKVDSDHDEARIQK